jgi:hypothetical protein
MFEGATADISDSTFEGNFGDAISVQLSTATITNSTFSGNITYTGAGVISNIAQLDLDGNKWPSTVTLINTTVTDTRSLGIKGNNIGTLINLDDGIVPAKFILRNSIVAGGFPGLPDVSHSGKSGGFISGGHNLIGNAGTITEFDHPGDQAGAPGSPIDPRLEVLAFNGGLTKTHALKLNSPAADKGRAFGSLTDQRGLLRPNDNPDLANAVDGDGSDIGAYEIQFPVSGSVSIVGRVTFAIGVARHRGYVTLTDSAQSTRFAPVNPAGFFRFKDVPLGHAYSVGLMAKGWTVRPQLIFTAEPIIELDLLADRNP